MAAARRTRIPPPGWIVDGARWIPEPVDVPIGTDPGQFRAWVRCSASPCPHRVEILIWAADLPIGDECARVERLAARRAEAGALLCPGCQRGHAPQVKGPARAPASSKAPPLPRTIRDLVRSGRAPSAQDPRGATWAWTRAQDALRELYAAAPAGYHAIASELLGELRQLPGWRPYWQDFFRTYPPSPEIHE